MVARAVALRGSRGAAVATRYTVRGAAVASRYGRRAAWTAFRYGTAAAVTLARWTRWTVDRARRGARRGRRYATAVAALSAATLVVTNTGLRGTGWRVRRALASGAAAFRYGATAGYRGLTVAARWTGEASRQGASGVSTAVDAAKSTVERLAGLGGRLRDGGNAAE
ncbi:hypothetical protein BRC70_06430 [Halobacteriales archaeon QH_6_68_27]|nr:MAG: hypothetical protein BRC70_06430 [Halobacteriales archaeon QH_6_68_27]